MTSEKDIKQLSILGISAIVLSVVVVLGIVILSAFSYTLRAGTTTAQVKDLLVIPAVLGDVAVGSTGTYPYLQGLSNCVNASSGEKFNSTYFTTLPGDVNGGYLYLVNISAGSPRNSSYFVGTTVNCSVSYLAATTASAGADTFSTGLLTFGTFLALIILAFIGKIIIGMFRNGL